MKQFIISFLCIFLSGFAMATGGEGGDEKGKEGKGKNSVKNTLRHNARPDLPGDLILDIGVNLFQNEPSDLNLGLFGSKTVNIYYMLPINIGKSNFSFHPGIGLGLEKYSFDKDVTLINNAGETEISTLADFLPEGASPKKTKLAANYLDIPVEFRYYTNKEDVSRSFKVAIGARAGLLFSAHTKIKYEEDGDMKKIKDKQSFNLNRLRYGAYGRIGIGGFSVFYNHNLSSLFETDKAPENADINTMTVGISITGF